eukprot:TRINITY_DN697_c1_g1_i1.p2 TRINITY_DN697_c1_g1~~TRINITY_DN697_c1_g1_i1.p2  ORF type:complete len:130 (+),score=30.44 TRINITY_DN697_c1_g1_i1:1552-1941(+)
MDVGDMGMDNDNVSFLVSTPDVRYADLGGIGSTIEELNGILDAPMNHQELCVKLGGGYPGGILLNGPPGVGKTSLADAVAGELSVAYYKVPAPSIISSMSGHSEQRIVRQPPQSHHDHSIIVPSGLSLH